MTIENYLRSFSEEELCEGAELMLSGEIKAERDQMAKQEVNKITSVGRQKEEDILFPYEMGRYYKCVVKTLRENQPDDHLPYRAEICIDRKSGLVMSTDCNCPVFSKDKYGCPHVAAALTVLCLDENGKEFLQGTKIEERLREMVGGEDPFIPGIMKRTDSRLRNILAPSAQENSLPVWEEKDSGFASPGNLIHCQAILGNIGNIGTMELKAGIQRLYVIKDIPEFIRAIENREPYSFGKTQVIPKRENFEGNSLKLVDLITSIHHAVGDNRLYLPNMATHDFRYLKLTPETLSLYTELCDGSEINFSDGASVPVHLGRKGLEATLRKKSYGASIAVKPFQIFCSLAEKNYLADRDGIFKINVFGEDAKILNALLNIDNEAYIRETDMPVFVSRMIPFFEKYGNLTLKGINPELYQKETPALELYLDLEDRETISCQPFVVYSNPDARFPLFNSSSGKARRNASAESEFARRLISEFDFYDPEEGKCYANQSEAELFRFLQKEIPSLQKDYTVFISEKLKRIKIKKISAVQVDIRHESSTLTMGIRAGTMSKKEMQEILSAFTLRKKYFRLEDGSFFDFEDTDTQMWDTLADLYQHYGKKDPSIFKVPLYRSLYLDEMLSGHRELVLNADEHYKNLLLLAKEEENTPIKIPSSLKGILRPYQEEGYRWITRLRKMGFGGILADDMGLGKTLQVLAFLLSEQGHAKAPALIVCPASLVYNWKKEVERFTPQLSSALIVGTPPERRQAMQDSLNADVWITSYDLLKRDIAFYEDITFSSEIVDEAQYIKNQTTQAAKSVRAVQAGFRLALTGTPIENRLGELWSIMDYLMPGFLYPYQRFEKEFELPIVQGNELGAQSLERLRHMVHPFILRRMKSDVLKELPEKQEETISIQLEGNQQQIYNAYALRLKQSLEKTSDRDFRSSKIQVLAEITRLRQICCDPALVVENYSGESAKLLACMELAHQAVDSGHKVLLFSQFTSMLDIICNKLGAEGISYYRLDGSTAKEKRIEMVDSFASDDVPVFCISLKAGGTGLNLTAADIVIHYDPWWNQAAQDQATDRTHRIGQMNKVTVYELVAKDTLEEKIQDMKRDKTKLMNDVLSGDTISSSELDREEILKLL